MTKTAKHIAVAALCGLVLASVAYGAHRVAQSRRGRQAASETSQALPSGAVIWDGNQYVPYEPYMEQKIQDGENVLRVPVNAQDGNYTGSGHYYTRKGNDL